MSDQSIGGEVDKTSNEEKKDGSSGPATPSLENPGPPTPVSSSSLDSQLASQAVAPQVARESAEGVPDKKDKDFVPVMVVQETGLPGGSSEGQSNDEPSVVSMPALPVSTPSREASPQPSQVEFNPNPSAEKAPSEASDTSAASAPAVVVGATSSGDDEPGGDLDGLDEYIRSPHGQNPIVERSPGGRYLRFMEKLGSGASKDVFRAYDTQEGIEVAWNVVNLSGVPKTERNRIVNEVRLLERLHHHNIISFHGSWVNRERQEVNFVTEILSSGTLKSFINKVQVIRWKIAKRWALQILNGLDYLHSQDPPVIHRDLKCENIFINGTSGDLRIGDLGLSTVHRDGRVLSVLGTPEFMAPDMYEEDSYDEKVDIYAFGMCLLEIFTKEIPYRECSNPAQIYKKVTRGEYPEVLSRLKSKHARDFIKYCLGYKDDSGNYVRPTAKDLLNHEFLLKRPNDDDEVKVDKPLIARTIREAPSQTSSQTGALSRKDASLQAISKSTSTTSQQVEPVQTTGASSSPSKTRSRSNSLEEDESDRFEEMPDSEVNMKKVKVLIGRGQELKEEDLGDRSAVSTQIQDQNLPSQGAKPHRSSSSSTAGKEEANTTSNIDTDEIERHKEGIDSVENPDNADKNGSLHYLVAAAVIDNESPNKRPYDDDILKLVVTLPVDGQTQNVQFDFHLIEDDAVKVAKEMVAELGIPQAAVLEISETVSALACTARMKQDKYLTRQRSQSASIVSPSPASALAGSSAAGLMPPAPIQPQQQMNPPNLPSSAQNSTHSLPDYVSSMAVGQKGTQQTNAHPHLPMQPHPPNQNSSLEHMTNQQPHPQHSLGQGGVSHHQHAGPVVHHQAGIHGSQPQSYAAHQVPSVQRGSNMDHVHVPLHAVSQGTSLPPQALHEQGNVHVHQSHAIAAPHSHVGVNTSSNQQGGTSQQIQPQVPVAEVHNNGAFPTNSSLPAQGGAQPLVHQMHAPQLPAASNAHMQNINVPMSHPVHSGTHVKSIQQTMLPNVPLQNVNPSGQIPLNGGENSPANVNHAVQPDPSLTTQPPLASLPPNHRQSSHGGGSGPLPTPDAAFVSPEDGKSLEVAPSSQGQDTSAITRANADPVDEGPHRSDSDDNQNHYEGKGLRSSLSQSEGIQTSVRGMSYDNLDDLGDDEKAELRRLDEEMQKTLMRAQKVFDSRMDNLQRTQTQREAQHQKTLEKHQKERAEFEKRVEQEQIEQLRRIEQLQKEWEEKREAFRQKSGPQDEASPQENGT